MCTRANTHQPPSNLNHNVCTCAHTHTHTPTTKSLKDQILFSKKSGHLSTIHQKKPMTNFFKTFFLTSLSLSKNYKRKGKKLQALDWKKNKNRKNDFFGASLNSSKHTSISLTTYQNSWCRDTVQTTLAAGKTQPGYCHQGNRRGCWRRWREGWNRGRRQCWHRCGSCNAPPQCCWCLWTGCLIKGFQHCCARNSMSSLQWLNSLHPPLLPDPYSHYAYYPGVSLLSLLCEI